MKRGYLQVSIGTEECSVAQIGLRPKTDHFPHGMGEILSPWLTLHEYATSIQVLGAVMLLKEKFIRSTSNIVTFTRPQNGLVRGVNPIFGAGC